MPYERVRHIEERFQRAIELIAENSLNARQLAVALKVSRPTAQRIVAELKHRGYVIRSVRDDRGWCYELISRPASVSGVGE